MCRSPKAPDADTDMGSHVFRYALLPHAHCWRTAGIVPAAWAFNAPLRMMTPPQGVSSLGMPAARPEMLMRSSLLEVRAPPWLWHRPCTLSLCGLLQSSARSKSVQTPAHTAIPFNPLVANSIPLRRAIIVGCITCMPQVSSRLPFAYPSSPLIVDTIKLAEPAIEMRTCPQPTTHCTTSLHHSSGPAVPQTNGAADYPPPPRCAASSVAASSGGAAPAGSGAASPTAGTSLIVRLYEPHGTRGVAKVTWPVTLPVVSAMLCNLLEDEQQPMALGSPVAGAPRVGIELQFRPFQVGSMTVRLSFCCVGSLSRELALCIKNSRHFECT